MSLNRSGRDLVAPLLGLAAAIALVATSAHAQNLDAGKSPDRLFADGCSACHRSPRGLAKGRFSVTLYWFLKDHYTSGPDTAKALASYIEAVDGATGPRAGATPKTEAKRPHAPRPPAAVEAH